MKAAEKGGEERIDPTLKKKMWVINKVNQEMLLMFFDLAERLEKANLL